MLPCRAPSTRTFQTPASLPRIGLARGSQPFQSPTTATEAALGAQTANSTPAGTTCAPSFS
jgi:hypothetical protein